MTTTQFRRTTDSSNIAFTERAGAISCPFLLYPIDNQLKHNQYEQHNIYPLSKARTSEHEHRETSQHYPDSSGELSRHFANPYSSHRPVWTSLLLDRTSIWRMYRTGFQVMPKQGDRSIHPLFDFTILPHTCPVHRTCMTFLSYNLFI